MIFVLFAVEARLKLTVHQPCFVSWSSELDFLHCYSGLLALILAKEYNLLNPKPVILVCRSSYPRSLTMARQGSSHIRD